MRGEEGATLHAARTPPPIADHPSSAATYPKGGKVRAALCIPGIPAVRLLSPAFLYMLAKLELVRREENCAESLYEVLLPFLAGGPLREATRDVPGHGTFESVQRAGTCFFRCILTATRVLLARVFGWPQPAVKLLFAAVRVAYLGATEEHLRRLGARGPEPLRPVLAGGGGGDPATSLRSRVGGSWDDAVVLPPVLTESDVTLVSMAARQTAAAVAKVVAAGTVGLEGITAAEATVRGVLATLHEVARASGLGRLVAYEAAPRSSLEARVRAALGRGLDHAHLERSLREGSERSAGVAGAAALDELVQRTAGGGSGGGGGGGLPAIESAAEAAAPTESDEGASSSFPPALAWTPADALLPERSCEYSGASA